MGRTYSNWWGLGVAAFFLVGQPAQALAGERKLVAVRHAEMSARPVTVVALPRSLGADHASSVKAMHGRRELAALPVRAMETRLSQDGPPTFAGLRRGEQGRGYKGGDEPGRHERKSVTLFRLNPKFGDVSVQPVVGGVNGAQVSVGF
jgi:hypothetical protein